MKRILVLDVCYPSEKNLYGDVFVHFRVKGYLALGYEVKVVSYFTSNPGWSYEGVTVETAATLDDLRTIAKQFQPDVIFNHIYTPDLFEFLREADVPVIVWIHGMEAMGFYRRLYDWSLRRLPWNVYDALLHSKRVLGFRRLVDLAGANRRIHFVAVSEWMRRLAQLDVLAWLPESSVIPNPIDTERFAYREKPPELRNRVLLIRPFHSKKYANEHAIAAILKLRSEPWFLEMHFEIHGSGVDYARLTSPLRGLPNVELVEGFVPNAAIPALHAKNGVLLTPTLQDAQGVSMCEAMSSGLVPISYGNTAIPEFVTHERSGILCDSPDGLAKALTRLHFDSDLFSKLSRGAASEIRAKCEFAAVIRREVDLAARLCAA
ncbi:MAG: glycosyltransferase family 4 protein [Archangium sp.]